MVATWPQRPAAVAPTLFASPVCLPLFKSRCLTPLVDPHWLIRAVCAVLRLPRGGACCLAIVGWASACARSLDPATAAFSSPQNPTAPGDAPAGPPRSAPWRHRMVNALSALVAERKASVSAISSGWRAERWRVLHPGRLSPHPGQNKNIDFPVPWDRGPAGGGSVMARQRRTDGRLKPGMTREPALTG